MLTPEKRLLSMQFNLRARQLFWRGLMPEAIPAWQLDGDALVDWVLNYQKEHGLLEDGCLGPSTLIDMAARARGGVGGFIINGQEIPVEGVRVARMFSPENSPTVTPDLCCILSMPEIARFTRDRLNGAAKMRAHFSIDSSKGPHDTACIVQWADPCRAVPFCPVTETQDYPKNRQCVGVELENFMLLYQIDADERHWRRRRPVTKASIGKKIVSQPILYDSQIRALGVVLDVLAQHVGIEKKFPISQGAYLTDMLEGDELDHAKGCLARFHYIQVNHEPGAGFVQALDTLFGKLDTPKREEPIPAQAQSSAPAPFDPAIFARQRSELQQTPQVTATFVPTHEDTPRFSLANAIASAHATGKGGRAARMAQKCAKFDDP